jgi:putative hydrolase of the HAD superfamily
VPLAIFDLDNTLIDRDAIFRDWAEELVEHHGLAPAELDWLVVTDEGGYVDRHTFFAAVRTRYGLAEPAETLLARYNRRMPELVRLVPEVISMLARLRRSGWRVAVATNGFTVQQELKLRVSGLADHIDAVAISEEVGAAKPGREIFDVAARRCGTTLDERTWMVGDCPIRDIGGAQTIGLRTMWVHRSREWNASAPPPDAIVGDVADAGAVITDWTVR